jgi:hypothetical protein
LLSSTFTDTASERNLADVVPYLQQYARKYNFDFRLVEMRWGIRAEASSAHQTSEICMAELERCQHLTPGSRYPPETPESAARVIPKPRSRRRDAAAQPQRRGKVEPRIPPTPLWVARGGTRNPRRPPTGPRRGHSQAH